MGTVTKTKDVVAGRVWRWFREALFPVFCFGCGQEGSWICAECWAVRPPVAIQRCAFCGVVSAHGETCAGCRRRHRLHGLTVRGVYREWVWRELIRSWKYGSARDLDVYANRLLGEAISFLPAREAGR